VGLVLAVACSPNPTVRAYYAKVGDFASELSRASQAHDRAAIRKFLRAEVTNGGLLFEDSACIKQFAAAGELREPKLDEFARCLATIDLKLVERAAALPDLVVLTYGAGIELEARFSEDDDGPRLRWIGYVARRDAQDALPTISPVALEALRIAGDSIAGLAAKTGLQEGAYVWLKVCINAEGAVTSADVRSATSPHVGRAVAQATGDWQFRPFVVRQQAMPVCSMLLAMGPVKQPLGKQYLPLPMPPTDLPRVPIDALHLSSGRYFDIGEPNKYEQNQTYYRAIRLLIGAFYFCIDEAGRVTRVQVIRPTGLDTYDLRIMKIVSSWVFQPFRDEDRPTGVCSAFKFAYRP
jgi:hypothetical protein